MTYLQEEETDSVPTDRNAKWQFWAHRCDCWLWSEPCFRALIWVCLASIKRHLKDCELAAKSLAGSKFTTLSSRKETLRLATDSTARPNLVQKQVDMSALYRILKLAIIVTSNCEHFNLKKKWTHVNKTPLASTSTWLTVMGGKYFEVSTADSTGWAVNRVRVVGANRPSKKNEWHWWWKWVHTAGNAARLSAPLPHT